MNAILSNHNLINEVTITLKEITDLLEVRHNDSMKKVEKLSEEPSFGALRKTHIAYNSQGQKIETYRLTKKQAIAVGAKLNNALLMKLIDKLEELSSNNKPLTFEEMAKNTILLADKKIKELENKISKDEPKVKFANAISGTTSNIDIETFAKALFDTEGIKMGRNKLMKWFRDNKFLTPKNKPYQTVLDRGLMTLKEGTYINNSTGELVTYTQPRLSGKGQIYFTNKLIDEGK